MRLILASIAIAVISGGIGFVAGAQDAPATSEIETLKINEVARVHTEIVTAEDLLTRIAKYQKNLPPNQHVIRPALESILAERLLNLESARIDTRIKQHEIDAEAKVLLGAEQRNFKRYNTELVAEQKARGMDPQPSTWKEYLKLRRQTTPEEFEAAMRTGAETIIKIRLVVGYWEISNVHAEAEGLMLNSEKAALDIRKRIITGPEELSALAYRNSQDSKTKSRNGAIGTVWKGDGRLDVEVDKVFWDLEEGELSQPIKTAQGWWLVRMTKKLLPNEQPLYEQRAGLMKSANIDENRFNAWTKSVTSSGRYKYEQRLPGIDYNPEDK